MGFRLPKYTDLTDNQREIVNLPYDKNFVVKGAPGTGKTVIALYRASDLCRAGEDVLMLVYNRPLKLYMQSAIDALGIDAEMNTWQAWIGNFYSENFSRTSPQINGQQFTYDWEIIQRDFLTLGRKYDQIILDEAQDLPSELIKSLTLIAGHIMCFMDPKQTITGSGSTPEEIADILNIRTMYSLYCNFRNTKEIYDFAKLFNPKEISDPVRSGYEKPGMIQFNGFGCVTYDNQVLRIAAVIRRNFGLNYIGVFTNNQSLNHMYNDLKLCLPDMDVYMYKSNTKHYDLDFSRPGVYVLSYSCMKGLEFDGVIISMMECINTKGDDDIDRNILYVAATRASEKLYCFYQRTHGSLKFIDSFKYIKGHENLLNWEELR